MLSLYIKVKVWDSCDWPGTEAEARSRSREFYITASAPVKISDPSGSDFRMLSQCVETAATCKVMIRMDVVYPDPFLKACWIRIRIRNPIQIWTRN
jgi:hypothetical protein